MKIEYAIIVKDDTRLEQLIQRFNTSGQARFYIESQGGDFVAYEREHAIFHAALAEVQRQLHGHLKVKLLPREHLTNFIFTDQMVVVVLGRDGLVANAAKYVNSAPVIGVNPDPSCYSGILLPFKVGNFIEAIVAVKSHTFSREDLPFAEAKLPDGQRLLAFNDLFIGARTHVSARYSIAHQGKTEQHSSSGIIVSTRSGSTGWLSSIYNMVNGITGDFLEVDPVKPDREELVFAVREPYLSVSTQCGIVSGRISRQQPLSIESFMPQNGVIFSDGVESDFLEFNSGTIVTIGLSKERVTLVQPTNKP